MHRHQATEAGTGGRGGGALPGWLKGWVGTGVVGVAAATMLPGVAGIVTATALGCG